jgi:hypothetical protein
VDSKSSLLMFAEKTNPVLMSCPIGEGVAFGAFSRGGRDEGHQRFEQQQSTSNKCFGSDRITFSSFE